VPGTPRPQRMETLPILARFHVKTWQLCEFLAIARKQANAAAMRLRVDIKRFADGRKRRQDQLPKLDVEISFPSWTSRVRLPSPAPIFSPGNKCSGVFCVSCSNLDIPGNHNYYPAAHKGLFSPSCKQGQEEIELN